MRADLTDMGQTMEALHQVDDRHRGADAVVHLGAIPAPGWAPGSELFRNNTISTYNVFASARHLGIQNIVWASSETVPGLPFDVPPPHLPVDEEYPPRPETAYALSKTMGEEMARQFCRWEPEMKIVSLRYSNVMRPEEYAQFPGFDGDPARRKWNLWSYIDARDAAQAVRKSLQAPITGAEAFIIASPDTVMKRSISELIEQFFPNVPCRGQLEPHQSAFSTGKARRLLGYEPAYSWRQGE